MQIQSPPQPVQKDIAPLVEPDVMGPFVEPDYDDDYYQEMIHNVDRDEPDFDWSNWSFNPIISLVSYGQDNSAISFSGGEGYQQNGFHSDTYSDSERIISAIWLVEENTNIIKDHYLEQESMPPAQPPLIQQSHSRTRFIVSDIKDAEFLSDADISSPSIFPIGPGLRRQNLDQQAYLLNAGTGSSSAPSLSRRVTIDETEQWTVPYQPAKIFKSDSMDQLTFDTSSNSVNNSPINDENMSQPTPTASPFSNLQ